MKFDSQGHFQFLTRSGNIRVCNYFACQSIELPMLGCHAVWNFSTSFISTSNELAKILQTYFFRPLQYLANPVLTPLWLMWLFSQLMGVGLHGWVDQLHPVMANTGIGATAQILRLRTVARTVPKRVSRQRTALDFAHPKRLGVLYCELLEALLCYKMKT